jgi:hypothetical protein
MNRETQRTSKVYRLQPVGIFFALVGVALFAYFIYKVGAGDILDGIKKLGFGFLLVLLISSMRLLVRSVAWILCFEPPYRLKFIDALKAVIIGEALSSLIPLGIIISGTAKAILVRNRVPFMIGLSAIAIENIFYSLSIAVFVTCGTLAFLLTFPLPDAWKTTSYIALALIASCTIFGYLIIHRGWRFSSFIVEWIYRRGLLKSVLETGRKEARLAEDRVYGFYKKNRQKFFPLLGLELCFHLAGVFEIYTILYFIADTPPTLMTAFVLEVVNRLITMIFKLIPFLFGVDEAGTSSMMKVLQFGELTGVTLAIIRKERIIFWTAIGVLLLMRRGFSLKEITDESETISHSAQSAQTSQSSALLTSDGT